QSTNLTNQTPIILISALSLLFAGFYIKRKESKYIFLLALTIGIGTTIHIQSVALIPFMGLLFFLYGKDYLKKTVLIFTGLFIPWIPVLIADYQNNFYNTQQILSYYTNEQASTSYDV